MYAILRKRMGVHLVKNQKVWLQTAAMACLIGAMALVVSACGKSSSYAGDSPASAPASAAAASPASSPAASASASAAASPAGEADVQVQAARFSWTLSQTDFKAGQTIRFKLSSTDGTHGFSIVGTDVSQQISQGESQEATWTPDAPGEYTIKCNFMCGSGHGTMSAKITVS
jgi:cytochrome c oxidase subunit 2